MAQLNESFVSSELPQSTGYYSPLPDGWYMAAIHSATIKNTKAGNGQFIAVRYDITGPTHQGRVVYSNINIKNQSSVAEEIGRQALGSIMRAIGLARLDDTDQLIGGALQIKLTTTKSEGYEPSNEVRGYKPASETATMPMPSASTPAPTVSTKSKAPWAK